VTEYRLVAEPRVDLDVGAAFAWYENEQIGLGLDFVNELRAAYDRIADGPFKYQDLRSEFGEHYYDVSRMRCTLPSRRTW